MFLFVTIKKNMTSQLNQQLVNILIDELLIDESMVIVLYVLFNYTKAF